MQYASEFLFHLGQLLGCSLHQDRLITVRDLHQSCHCPLVLPIERLQVVNSGHLMRRSVRGLCSSTCCCFWPLQITRQTEDDIFSVTIIRLSYAIRSTTRIVS